MLRGLISLIVQVTSCHLFFSRWRRSKRTKTGISDKLLITGHFLRDRRQGVIVGVGVVSGLIFLIEVSHVDDRNMLEVSLDSFNCLISLSTFSGRFAGWGDAVPAYSTVCSSLGRWNGKMGRNYSHKNNVNQASMSADVHAMKFCVRLVQRAMSVVILRWALIQGSLLFPVLRDPAHFCFYKISNSHSTSHRSIKFNSIRTQYLLVSPHKIIRVIVTRNKSSMWLHIISVHPWIAVCSHIRIYENSQEETCFQIFDQP